MGASSYLAYAAFAVAAGGTAVSVQNSKNQTRAAETVTDQQNKKQIALETDLQNKQVNDESIQSSKAIRASLTGSSTTGPGGIKGGTVLTSPLGIPSQQNSGNKTLLGM